MTAYVPGETPANAGAVKLNQNESPYPPSPRVAQAVREAAGNLSRYPDSPASSLRAAAARLYGLAPDQVMATNGSDEFLRILYQASAGENEEVAAFYPSYTYYRTLAAIQGAKYRLIDFTDDYNLPASLDLSRTRLALLPNPNAPSGTLFGAGDIVRLCREAKNGLVCVDEAYADYAGASVLGLLAGPDAPPNLVVTRTFSKSYGLAGLRVGLGFASAGLMAQLDKVRDYYNVDRLAQAAALAALEDQEYMAGTTARVVATRDRAVAELTGRGVFVWPTRANFILVRLANAAEAKGAYEWLRRKEVFVRYFNAPRLADHLRITVGTDREMGRFLDEFDAWRGRTRTIQSVPPG